MWKLGAWLHPQASTIGNQLLYNMYVETAHMPGKIIASLPKPAIAQPLH